MPKSRVGGARHIFRSPQARTKRHRRSWGRAAGHLCAVDACLPGSLLGPNLLLETPLAWKSTWHFLCHRKPIGTVRSSTLTWRVDHLEEYRRHACQSARNFDPSDRRAILPPAGGGSSRCSGPQLRALASSGGAEQRGAVLCRLGVKAGRRSAHLRHPIPLSSKPFPLSCPQSTLPTAHRLCCDSWIARGEHMPAKRLIGVRDRHTVEKPADESPGEFMLRRILPHRALPPIVQPTDYSGPRPNSRTDAPPRAPARRNESICIAQYPS